MLGPSSENFRLLFVVFAVGYIVAGFVSRPLPSVVMAERKQSYLADFSLLWRDRLFGYVCLTWFITAAAIHWLGPYRTNLLIEERFGFQYEPWLVILTLTIIPDLLRLLTLPLMGYLFDRINLIWLRIFVSVFLILYVACFFCGQNLFFHILGMVFLGTGMAATAITWNLWVTKLAPPEKVPSYMAVHTTLTGLRLTVIPLIGLWSLSRYGSTVCAMISLALLALSIVMLIPILKKGQERFRY